MTDPIQRLRDLLAKAKPKEWAGIMAFIVEAEKGPHATVCSFVNCDGDTRYNQRLIIAAINALPALLDVVEAAKAIEIRGEPSMSGGYHAGSYRLSHMQSDALERLVKALAKLEGIK